MEDSSKEFLRNLRHELNTQDNCGNREPVYWLIKESCTEPTSEEYADAGWLIYDDEQSEIAGEANNIESAKEYIRNFSLADCPPELKKKFDEEDGLDDLMYLLDNMNIQAYRLIHLKHVERYANDAMFITLQDCKDHIAKYGYNYKNPRPYANTACRSPKYEQLLKIIKETEW